MPEITPQGYKFIKEKIFASWKYVRLKDENEQEIIKLFPEDYRLQFNEREGEQLIELNLIIKGNDHDMPELPVTLRYISLYSDDFTGDAVAIDEFDPPISIESLQDEIEIDLLVEIPRITM